jgi:ABC-type Fe3+ transport system permease subunit
MLILISSLLTEGIIQNSLSEDFSNMIGLIILLVLVTAAVGIFIFSGMNFERYAYMEKGVQLPGNMENELQQRYDRYTPVFYLKLIIGVCLLILSPISIFITSMISDVANLFGVVVLLLIVACAVFLFISAGTIRESYQRLLKVGDYTAQQLNKKEDKVIGAVAAIVWPLAVVVFLFCGFVYNLWHIAWIVFPITGILFGMFSAAYSIITGKNE